MYDEIDIKDLKITLDWGIVSWNESNPEKILFEATKTNLSMQDLEEIDTQIASFDALFIGTNVDPTEKAEALTIDFAGYDEKDIKSTDIYNPIKDFKVTNKYGIITWIRLKPNKLLFEQTKLKLSRKDIEKIKTQIDEIDAMFFGVEDYDEVNKTK